MAWLYIETGVWVNEDDLAVKFGTAEVRSKYYGASHSPTSQSSPGPGVPVPIPPTPTVPPTNNVAPTVVTPPVITGVLAEGETLTISPATFAGNPTPTVVHQMKRDGAVIDGATNLEYVVQNADVGTTLTVEATGTNIVDSVSVTSAGVAIAAPSGLLFSDQGVSFGALTLANAGGAQLVHAGATTFTITVDATGTYAVTNSGVLTCTATPTATTLTIEAGDGITTDTADITVTTEADTYSASSGDLSAILALGSGVIDGKTIKGRPGKDLISDTPGTVLEFGSSLTFTTGLTITSHDTSDKAYLRRMKWRYQGTLNLISMKIRDTFVSGVDSYDNTGIIRFAGPSQPSVLNMDLCEVYSDNVTLLNYTTPECLRGLTIDGGDIGQNEITITRCHFHDLVRGITGNYHSWDIRKNTFELHYADFLSLSVKGTETKMDFIDNILTKAEGVATDPKNPHVDGVQINQGVMTQDNTVPLQIIGNICWPGDSRSQSIQIFFMENINAPRRLYFVAEHNVGMTISQHGLSCERPGVNSRVRGNTFLNDASTASGESVNIPSINMVSSSFPTDDLSSVWVQYNISPGVDSVNSTVRDNYLFGNLPTENQESDYAALLTGTGFEGADYATVGALLTGVTPDGNTTLWPANKPRRGALGGYYVHNTDQTTLTAGVSDAPWDETAFTLAFVDKTGQTKGAVVESAALTVPTVGSKGVDVWAESGEIQLLDASDVVLVDWTTDAVLALTGYKVKVRHTASLSGLTTTNQVVHAGTQTDTFSVTTVS